jgi:hypothetical protein
MSIPKRMAPKTSWEKLDYDLGFANILDVGDGIADVSQITTVIIPTGDPNDLIAVLPAYDGTTKIFKIWLDKGVDGVEYRIEARATTQAGRQLEIDIIVPVQD